jgi:branched-chain amino acid transport system permease protein
LTFWLQQLLNGLFLGSIYALIALGYTMVYGVLRLINFAHGDIFMVGAFVGYWVLSQEGLSSGPAWLALLVALLAAMGGCALLGVGIERWAYRPLRTAHLSDLAMGLGVWLFFIFYTVLSLLQLPAAAAVGWAVLLAGVWSAALVWAVRSSSPRAGPARPGGGREGIRRALGAGVGLYGLGVGALGWAHQPWPVALFLPLLGALGWAGVVGLLRRRSVQPAPRLAALITAIGVSLLLENLGVIWLGPAVRAYPQTISSASFPGLQARYGLAINAQQITIFWTAVALMCLLHLFITRTRVGRAMRAVSYDWETAQLMGINVNSVIAVTFAVGSALAGAGGLLYGMRFNSVDPQMGILPGLKAFVAAVLGGIGDIRGAMLGGMLMGLVEILVSGLSWHVTTGVDFTGSTLRDALAFALLIAVLIVKPTGLMGRHEPEKV